jgi:hypothetical protein
VAPGGDTPAASRRSPAAAHTAVKERANANAIALAPVENLRRDSDLFGARAGDPDVESRIEAAIERGVQTRNRELTISQVPSNLR